LDLKEDAEETYAEKIRRKLGKEDGETVRVFGGELDASFAGAKAISRAKILQVLSEEEGKEAEELASQSERAEIFYAEAVDTMNRGKYDAAVTLLNRACYYSGPSTRRGGQMQLWLAQALYAAKTGDNRAKAIQLLEILEKHPSYDVRTVAKELKFILNAPELKLDSSNFVNFDTDKFNDDSTWQRRPDGQIVKSNRRKLPEEPEYGSIEWALAQSKLAAKKEPEEPLFNRTSLAVAAGLFLASLFFFSSNNSSSPSP